MGRTKRVLVSGGRAFLGGKERQRQITEIEIQELIKRLIVKEFKKLEKGLPELERIIKDLKD